MSDSFFKKLSLLAGLFVLAAIFGLLIFVANLEIKDLDLWLHLGMGKYIVTHNFHIPNVDMLSCTIPGKAWVNHEWLFQVIVYWTHQLWGPDGIITMQVVLVTLTMMILFFLGYSREKQLATIFILLLVSLVYQQRFTTRPDLFSLLFFALYIFILSFYLDRRWSIYVLFVIQVLWSNIHGFFFFGPLFVLIGFSSEWIKRHVKLPYEWNKAGRLNNDEYRRLKWILGAVVLACLINPLGIKGAWYPIGVFFQISGESKIFFEKIIELRRPITSATLFSAVHYPFYKLLIVLSALSIFYNRRKLDIGVVIFWLVFLIFSLAAVRNLIFFAFAAYLVFVTNALSISLSHIVPIRVRDKKFSHLLSTVLKIFLTIWIIQYGTDLSVNGYFDFEKYERKSEFGGVSQRNFPVHAVDFLQKNKIRGNFFNDFNSGAYLIGHCYPDIKVFIDGRTEVYGPKFFHDYIAIWEKDNPDKLAEALEKYSLTGVFMNSVHQPIPKKDLKYLYDSKEWIPIYFDYDGVIFLKDIEANREWIDQFALDLTQWQPKELDLYRLGAKRVTPYRNINRAFSLLDMGLDVPAELEARAALDVYPGYGSAYRVLGKIYTGRKDYGQAFENVRLSAMYEPRNEKLRRNLALAYYDLEEYEHAVEEYEGIIESWPKKPQAYFLLGRTLIKQGKYARGIGVLRKAHSLDNQVVEDILEIGDSAMEQEAFLAAADIYRIALGSGKKIPKIYQKIAEAFMAQGEEEKAREAIVEGLSIEAEHKELQTLLEQLP